MTDPADSPPFAVGDRVTTNFDEHDADTVRTIVAVRPKGTTPGGYLVGATTAPPCPACGRGGRPLPEWLDAVWFRRAAGKDKPE